MRTKVIIGIAAVLVALLTACGDGVATVEEDTTAPRSAPAAPEPAPEPVESEESWEEFELELFEILAEPEVTKIMDRETCDLVALVGPEPFIDAYREGWEVSADWRPEFNGILLDIIESAC